jgi:hypothetical protein
VPSAIAVVACLSDLYYDVRKTLTKFALDRMENDHGIQRLKLNRSLPEINAIVGQRLNCIYDAAGIVHRPGRETYPFPETLLKRLEGHRTRDVLDRCHAYQTQCMLTGELLADEIQTDHPDPTPPRDKILDEIAIAWNDMVASTTTVPEDDERVLWAISTAARACADENAFELSVTTTNNPAFFCVALTSEFNSVELRIAVTNKSTKGGGFRNQIDGLRARLRGAVPIALRTFAFPQSQVGVEAIEELTSAGGRSIFVDGSTLSALVAIQRFAPDYTEEQMMAWRRRDRPISTLTLMNQIFDIDRLNGLQPPQAASPEIEVDRPPGTASASSSPSKNPGKKQAKKKKSASKS